MSALTERKFLTDDERERLESVLMREPRTRDSLMLRLALRTGARSVELLGVTVADFGKRNVTLRGAKGSNDRTIPLQAALADDVARFISEAGLGGADRLFNITTRQYRRIWAYYNPARGKSSKSTRHTFGVKLYDNCRSIVAVKTALGHKNVNNTMVYLDFVEGQKGLKNKMSGMWSKQLDESEE